MPRAQMPLCKHIYTSVHTCIAELSTGPLLADGSMEQHGPPHPGECLHLPDHEYSSGTLRCRLGLLFRACTGKTVPDVKEVLNHTGNG